jgi:hypothetical protein
VSWERATISLASSIVVVVASVGVAVMRRQIVDRDLRHLRTGVGSEVKAVMRHDLRAGFLDEAHGAAEVVGMGVGHDDRVDVLHLETRLAQALLHDAPGGGAGEARVDDRGAFGVQDRVAVHVAEPGKVDGELHPEHVRGHLDHLGARGLLLLSLRHARKLEDMGQGAPAARRVPATHR